MTVCGRMTFEEIRTALNSVALGGQVCLSIVLSCVS